MRISAKVRRNLPAAMAAMAGIILSLLAYTQARNWEQEKLRDTFNRAAEERVHALREGISANLNVLQSVVAFYGASDSVSRREFNVYVSPIIRRHPTIQALEWIPRVPGELRAQYEESTKAEGHSQFEFRERGPDGAMVRAGTRPEYFPVFYVEPAEGNTKAFGFDLGSEHTRRKALEDARDTGKIVVSERIELVQEVGESYAVLAFLPIYRNDLPTATVLDRHRNLKGFALGVLRIKNIVERADPHNEAGARENGLRVVVLDTSAPADKQLLYSSAPLDSSTAEFREVSEFHHASSVSAGNRQWSVLVLPSGDWADGGVIPQALTTLVAGLLCSGLLVAYLRFTSNKRLQIETEVQKRTREISDISRKLRDREQRIRAVHDTLVDGVITIDDRGIIETANPAAEQIFGYASEEIIGRNVRMLMPEPHRGGHDGYIGSFIETGEAKVIGIGRELVGQRRDGGTFPMELAVNEMRIGSQRMFTGIVRDITERKIVDQMKSEFVSTVSHELRTPLASIVGYSDLIMDGDAGAISEETKQFVEIISNNSVRLTDLINDLLDIEKMENQKFKLELKPLRLRDVLQTVHDTFRLPAEQKELALDVSISGALHLEGDADRLTQVFSNLLSNAIKYTREGSVKVSAERFGEEIVVKVADTGIGISDGDLAKLFEKFFRANDEYSRSVGGTGLGLSIAKSIVEEHRGSIEGQSKLGEGAEFTVRLPALDQRCDRTSGVTSQSGREQDPPSILVIGNDSYPDEAIRSEMIGLGVETVFTTNAEEGIMLAGLLKPAMVVLEMLLEHGDGLRVAWRLKKESPTANLPVALVSLFPDGNGTVRPGACSFVPKQILATGLQQFTKTRLGADGGRVLVIDDDPDFGAILNLTLQKYGVESDVGTSGAKAIELCGANSYQLVLMDYHLPDMTGADILKHLRYELNINTPVVMMSGATIEKGVQREVHTVGFGQSQGGIMGIAGFAASLKAELDRRV